MTFWMPPLDVDNALPHDHSGVCRISRIHVPNHSSPRHFLPSPRSIHLHCPLRTGHALKLTLPASSAIITAGSSLITQLTAVQSSRSEGLVSRASLSTPSYNTGRLAVCHEVKHRQRPAQLQHCAGETRACTPDSSVSIQGVQAAQTAASTCAKAAVTEQIQWLQHSVDEHERQLEAAFHCRTQQTAIDNCESD